MLDLTAKRHAELAAWLDEHVTPDRLQAARAEHFEAQTAKQKKERHAAAERVRTALVAALPKEGVHLMDDGQVLDLAGQVARAWRGGA